MSLFEIRTSLTQRRKFIWLSLFLLPVAWQLWVWPYAGLADNGDFVKVAGRFGLSAMDPVGQKTFHFFERIWHKDVNTLWVSPYWGVEVWLAQLAVGIAPTNPFDIRWLGLLHACIFGVFAWLIIGKRPIPNLFAILAFTDAAYVTYFQSFYFDTASLLFLLVFFAAWLRGATIPLAVAGLGFALSKGPHAPAALLLSALLLAQRRWSFAPAALALLIGGGYMLSQTRDEYKATAYYNLAFSKLGLLDPDALDALKIRLEDRKLLGTNAFESQSPAQSEIWLKGFFPNGGYRNALVYYALHPGIAAHVLYSDLANEASQIRAVNLGNYERSSGVRYCTLSTSFGWWSAAKSWLFRVAPWHVFLLVPFAFLVAWREPALRWPLIGVMGVGGYEFAIASLADACETYRHLLLFHVCFDLLLFLAFTQLQRDSQL